jgi:hypothetical protein
MLRLLHLFHESSGLLFLAWIAAFICLAASIWAAGALYFDGGGRVAWRGILLALAWIAAVAGTFAMIRPYWLAVAVFATLFSAILAWWFGQKPTHDRRWDPNFARLPRLAVSGDTVTVENVRNTQYRSLTDYDCRFETRSYRLSDVQAVDVLILYWGSPWMCHPMAIFDFGNGQHLCFSIEVRYREGESYDALRSFYRQNELMYVVCDERDAILRRTKYSHKHDVYLYRLQAEPDHARQLFQEYMESTNDICERPRWYNTVTSNCTTSIYFQRKGQIPWDWRMLFNGSFDKMLYDRGRLYQELPFAELRQRSLINEVANQASLKDFSAEIRAGLPGF